MQRENNAFLKHKYTKQSLYRLIYQLYSTVYFDREAVTFQKLNFAR